MTYSILTDLIVFSESSEDYLGAIDSISKLGKKLKATITQKLHNVNSKAFWMTTLPKKIHCAIFSHVYEWKPTITNHRLVRKQFDNNERLVQINTCFSYRTKLCFLLFIQQSKEKMMKGVRRGCVRLKGAVIGIDDQDVNTFTITVDHKTFHFQVGLLSMKKYKSLIIDRSYSTTSFLLGKRCRRTRKMGPPTGGYHPSARQSKSGPLGSTVQRWQQ